MAAGFTGAQRVKPPCTPAPSPSATGADVIERGLGIVARIIARRARETQPNFLMGKPDEANEGRPLHNFLAGEEVAR